MDVFRIDDLLDFSNDDLFSSSSVADSCSTHTPLPADYSSSTSAAAASHYSDPSNLISYGGFTADDLCLHSEDVAQLEWLSQFVDDSFSDFGHAHTHFSAEASNFRPESSFPGRSRSKRSKPPAASKWVSPSKSEPGPELLGPGKARANGGNRKKEGSPAGSEQAEVRRRCTHCASEKTPQWRTGPLGAKTLCNACGVRFKSGRLVPEYRPAASPTFVLTQHSNSHRKVMELRRQKEENRGQQPQQQQKLYHYAHQNYEVC